MYSGVKTAMAAGFAQVMTGVAGSIVQVVVVLPVVSSAVSFGVNVTAKL